jgi:hypothetical protein
MSSADLPWSGLWPGGVAGVVQAAAHARARCARLARARVVQGAAAGELPEFGGPRRRRLLRSASRGCPAAGRPAVRRPVRRRSGAGAGRGWGLRGRGRRRGRSSAARLRSRRPASQPPPTTPARRRARPFLKSSRPGRARRAHRAFGNASRGRRSSPAPSPATRHTGSSGPCWVNCASVVVATMMAGAAAAVP